VCPASAAASQAKDAMLAASAAHRIAPAESQAKSSAGGEPAGWAWSNTTQAWRCCAALVRSPISNHWIRRVSITVAANGPLDNTSAARKHQDLGGGIAGAAPTSRFT